MSRRVLRTLTVAATAALVALSASACSTGPTDTAGDETPVVSTGPEEGAYPVTVEHAYGKVTLREQPRRVVTLGWSDQDVALALGVVPVGATKITWGGNPAGSTPWFDARLDELDGAAPVRYDDSDGVPFDEIAALQPDLVLATNSGLTRAEYAKLSKLAPVIAFPGEPWQTTWQDSLRMVGRALGLPERAARLVEDTRAAIGNTAAKYPQLESKTTAFLALSATDLSRIDYYTPADNRTRLLTELGMRTAPVIERLARKVDGFYGSLSAERAGELGAQVVITYVESPADLERFREDPLLGRIPAFGTGAVVAAADRTAALGMSSPSPLSIPYTLEHFVPEVAEAATRAEAAGEGSRAS